MDIIFKFGEHFYESNNPTIFFQFLITIIGAFFGFLGALWVSNINDRKIKKERIKYLKSLLQGILKTTEKQIENINSFILELDNNPYEINKLIWQATNDLKRYLRFDSQELFSSFINYDNTFISSIFRNQNHESKRIEDFNNINAVIDFIDLAFDTIKSDQDIYVKSTYNRQLFIKESIQKISNELSIVVESIAKNNPNDYRERDDWILLDSFLGIYQRLIENHASIQTFLNEFVDPLRHAIINNNLHRSKNIDSLLFNCLNAFIVNNDIKVDSEGLSTDLKGILEKISPEFDKLKISCELYFNLKKDV